VSAPEVALISPFASRHWLASEIAALMKQAECTAGDLARQARVDPRKISYLLKAERKSSVDDVARILEQLQVPALRLGSILKIAEDAERGGWWERYSIEMGSRQATYADLEAGAAIVEFTQTLVPGLLQTEAYAMGRAVADRLYHSKRFLVDRAVEARTLRKQVLSGPDARGYQVVVDEAVLRRAVASPAVIRDQVDHMVGVAMQTSAVTIRVLLLGTPLPGDAIPATSFSIYRYPELEGFEVVAVETDDTDLFITEPAKTAAYRERFEALRSAALSPSDTLDFLVVEAENPSRAARRSA
jgi:transcriptional regulator with XRE-family HTH domain